MNLEAPSISESHIPDKKCSAVPSFSITLHHTKLLFMYILSSWISCGLESDLGHGSLILMSLSSLPGQCAYIFVINKTNAQACMLSSLGL